MRVSGLALMPKMDSCRRLMWRSRPPQASCVSGSRVTIAQREHGHWPDEDPAEAHRRYEL